MRRPIVIALPFVLLAGCAGYASDYWRPKVGIIAPQLSRYGFDQGQAECAGRRLGGGLSVWQLRQLERIARFVPPGHFGRSALQPRDLVIVAAHVRDLAVRSEVTAAVATCAPPPPMPVASAVPERLAAPGAPLWLNLGAATTGQSIAVNATSLVEESGFRQAWFRLTDPGATGPSDTSYLLRIDCAARTINSMAMRRPGPDGRAAEQNYGPGGEGAVPIAGGTVMEIAFLALCT